ncbi:hypothetical protein CC86DRAFT_345062 [Ophiobolus disseminans]|uniref:tRNA(Phe) 7-[(3-amino-3-carboxypropyl)-4-demethylwyosine(37)-N(4)]-methyltransferase n=1 Tax=Ophiobolus disseminans TaxID=1469910 RepID=A0A6A7AB60_9PLEO|nr:hypothetical protein CC86DRAFT_345062 [Ophiobolus disseminans]
MTTRFESRKRNILEQLGVPDGEYHDLSPKGSVDEPIRRLIGEINALEGLVTTSSCSGRISVFLEGHKVGSHDQLLEQTGDARAGPGGKGGGGAWLFISHSPVDESHVTTAEAYLSLCGLDSAATKEGEEPGVQSRYIHLKFEPMILHVLTASTIHAQRVLTAALSAGFRESGAVSLSTTKSGDSTPMVAVRSTGYSFDSVIGYQDESDRKIPIVDEKYLRILVAIANDRFKINAERIARFRHALIEAFSPSAGASSKPEWEDADARQRRKREEGLARQRALRSDSSDIKDRAQVEEAADASVHNMFQ